MNNFKWWIFGCKYAEANISSEKKREIQVASIKFDGVEIYDMKNNGSRWISSQFPMAW